MQRKAIRLVLILISSIVVGYLLLVLSYLIPLNMGNSNMQYSSMTLSQEGKYPQEIYSRRTLDNFTDSLMLLESLSSSRGAFLSAIETPYYTIEGAEPYETFVRGGSGEDHSLEPVNYQRYWHGYQLFVRPLLLVFNYEQIRTINSVVLYSLIMLIALIMINKVPMCVLPYLITMLLLSPTAIVKSLQYSSVTYVTLFTMLFLLINYKNTNKGKEEFVFLFSGIAVAYLDLLTFPTIALTMPLVLLCAIHPDREVKKLILMLKCIVFWGIGYIGMWAGKWLLCVVFEDSTFIDSLTAQIRFRAGSEFQGESISRLTMLKNNISNLFQNSNCVVVIVAYLLIILMLSVKKNGASIFSSIKANYIYIIPAIIPICWLIVTTNHSYIHSWFTYRTLAPTVYSILCGMDMRNTNSQYLSQK